MKFLILILAFLLYWDNIHSQKILIIGSGVAGASTAHYLATHFKNVEINVFEKESRIGGRTHSVNNPPVKNVSFEFGASFYIANNRLLSSLLAEYELKGYKSSQYESGASDNTFSLSDGDKIILSLGSYKIIDFARLVWRYGFSFLKLNSQVHDLVTDFEKIYNYLSDFEENPYENHEGLFEIVGIKHLVNQSFREYLLNLGYNQLYIDEFLKGILVSIYNQEQMNAFAGMISLAGVFNPSYNIFGGNRQLSEKILTENRRNKIKTQMNHRVISIEQRSDGKLAVTYISFEGKKVDIFDVIVIAAPNYGEIIIDSKLNPETSTRSYKRTVVSYISGIFKPEKLHLKVEEDLSKFTIFLNKNQTGFSEFKVVCRFCIQNKNNQSVNVYKLNFDFQPSIELLKEYFDDVEIIESMDWHFAYPELKPISLEKLPKLRMASGLYYINGIEFAASCMEIEIITAKNTVNLIAKYEGKNWEKETSNAQKKEPNDKIDL